MKRFIPTPYAILAIILAFSVLGIGTMMVSDQAKISEAAAARKEGLEGCLAKAKASYDTETDDWERRLLDKGLRPGTIDPFVRAKKYYDDSRYGCYVFYETEAPADLKVKN